MYAHTNTQSFIDCFDVHIIHPQVPINRQRRRPYLVIGWALVIAAMAGLAMVGRPGFPALMACVSPSC